MAVVKPWIEVDWKTSYLTDNTAPCVCGGLWIVLTPKVVSELMTKAVVSSGAGLLGHGEGEAVGVGVGEGHAAPGEAPGNQRRGVSCVPQGGVRF